jgi:hypothetical protein
MSVADVDNNLIDQLPERQLKLGTSLSEPASSNRSPTISPDEVDLENGGGYLMIRAASFSGEERKKPNQTNSFFNVRNFLPMIPPSLTRQPSVPVFYCAICLENHPVSDCFTSSTCDHLHQYCRESIKTFAESLVNEGGVKIRCPGFGECQGILTEQEIKNLCDEGTWNKYQRFREMKENPNFRECPSCNHPHIGNESSPEITCEQCHQVYCFFHANAHPNILCHQYTREQLKSQMKSYAFIKSNTRNCPTCSTPTEKNGGCNHMTCQHCHANWCWLCGRLMGSDHFDDPINGCLGGQFAPPPPFALWTILPCLRSPYLAWLPRIPALLLVTIALVVALGSCLLGVVLCGLFLPITLPLGALLSCVFDYLSEREVETLVMVPAFFICGLIGSIFCLLLELIWLPVPLALSIVLFPLFLFSRDSSVNDPDRAPVWSYFACVDSELSPFWCYPVATVINGIEAVGDCFRSDDD